MIMSLWYDVKIAGETRYLFYDNENNTWKLIDCFYNIKACRKQL